MANTVRKAGPRTTGTVSIPWVSNAGGAASVAVAAIRALIYRVVFVPDGGGLAPTTLYDVALNDANGCNVLGTGGADRSATVAEQYVPSDPVLVDGPLTLAVTNAGDSNSGTVILYCD
jgi:hypothetical protein